MLALIADQTEQFGDSVRVVTVATTSDLDSFFGITGTNSESFVQVKKQFAQDSGEALLKQMSKA